MAIEVDTKDCTALSDTEMEEMAQISAHGGAVEYTVGLISKQAGEWVLVTQVRDNGRLMAYSFFTLERVGGTPAILIGMASVKRHSRRSTALRAMISDQLRRAVLAFPDEDVLVGAMMAEPSAYEAYSSLDSVVPRPGYRASGEDRAWGRRLVKRMGPAGTYADREFRIEGEGSIPLVIDHEALDTGSIPEEISELFAGLEPSRGDCLVVHGWAMAEFLEKLAP